MPLTSRQNNLTGTPANTVIPSPSPSASTPPPVSSPKSETPWRHRKHLLTSTARISDHPVPVLFDEGSQVNVISPQIVIQLSLPTARLPSPRRIMFPNGQHADITHFVPHLFPVFPCYSIKQRIPSTSLFYHCINHGNTLSTHSRCPLSTLLEHLITSL